MHVGDELVRGTVAIAGALVLGLLAKFRFGRKGRAGDKTDLGLD